MGSPAPEDVHHSGIAERRRISLEALTQALGGGYFLLPGIRRSNSSRSMVPTRPPPPLPPLLARAAGSAAFDMSDDAGAPSKTGENDGSARGRGRPPKRSAAAIAALTQALALRTARFQVLALGKAGRDGRGQRAPGAVGVAGGDARR